MEFPPYLPITSDYGFKVTFGNPDNTLFLRRALQALIQSEVPIREVVLDRNAFEGLTIESRGGVYDLSCIDEQGRHFIVEMQVAHSPHFLQRLKFYAFHKLNGLVNRGNFSWGGLPPIYCVALLSRSILPGADYRTVANLRTETGELLDPQLTFVLVELDKFRLPEAAVRTDLEKLLFTMQTLDESPLDLRHYPEFWGEDWLRVAVEELSTRNMTLEQREQFARVIARRIDQITAEEERLESERKQQESERKQQESEQARQQAEQERQQAEQQLKNTVRNLLLTGRFTEQEVADLSGSALEQVQRWKENQ